MNHLGRNKVPVPLKLKVLFRPRISQRMLGDGGNALQHVRVQVFIAHQATFFNDSFTV
jgi:hypothetical protein